MKKSNKFIAGILAIGMVILSGTVSARDVWVSTDKKAANGYSGSALYYSNPSGFLDVYKNTTSFGGYIYVIARNPLGIHFICTTSPSDPGYSMISDTIQNLTSGSFVSANIINGNKCNFISVAN